MTPIDTELCALMARVSKIAILPRYQSLAAGEIEEKASDDLVTIADREAEDMLTEALAKLDPSLPVVGEEAAHADPSVLDALGSDCWIVDPLDGTNNFARGKPPFGIIVARARGGVAEAGWIYDCLTGRFCHAHAGGGAFLDGDRVTARPTGGAPPVAAISLVYFDPAKREAVKRHIAPHYTLVDIPRCAAEQYPRVALGENDVSVFERTLAWDHAAGALWLNEAGGKVARPNGDAYRVDERDRTGLIGAASPALWRALAERMGALAD